MRAEPDALAVLGHGPQSAAVTTSPLFLTHRGPAGWVSANTTTPLVADILVLLGVGYFRLNPGAASLQPRGRKSMLHVQPREQVREGNLS